jgi:competence protein ComEC
VAALLLWLVGVAALRRFPRAGSVLVLAAVLLAVRSATPSASVPSLVMLDVGHGQAILLRTRDRAVLVDAGSHSRRNAGARVVVPALRALGIVRLDTIVCTHADADHWNAIPEILVRLPVGRVVVGDDPPAGLLAAAASQDVPVVRARPGAQLLAGTDRASLRALPGRPPQPDTNEGSLALVFEANGHRVLLPADREREGLAALLDAGLPRCAVLVAPHHGARCELAPRLADAVRPQLLLVSARARFADAETIAHYRARQVLRTFESGCVTVTLERGHPPTARVFRTPPACYDPPP